VTVDKAPDAFRTISEVAEELDVPQHVLRFWESRFHEIKPLKRGGGRRYYRPEDVALLRGIRHLLYGEGYTIRGVQRLLREQGTGFVQEIWQPGAAQPARPPLEDAADEGVEAATPPRAPAPFIPPLHGENAQRSEPRLEPSMVVRPPSVPPPTSTAAAPARGLAADDVRKLNDALRDLAECRRLLDTAFDTQP
jgi:DNA-binding transcriptional MerR regulator